MTRKIALMTVLAVAAALTGLTFAGHHEKAITVEGEIMCAMCVMKDDGAKDCQNVLRVKKGDETVDFYLVKNDVAEDFGHACSGAKGAQVTGIVTEKDGKMWLTASKMEPVEEKA